jgi:hypothetical protein
MKSIGLLLGVLGSEIPFKKLEKPRQPSQAGGQMQVGERKCLSTCPPLAWPDQLEGLRPQSFKGLS